MLWQPAVPDGLCSSALRSTVGKGAKLTRVQHAAAAAAAAAADKRGGGVWSDREAESGRMLS